MREFSVRPSAGARNQRKTGIPQVCNQLTDLSWHALYPTVTSAGLRGAKAAAYQVFNRGNLIDYYLIL
jgi:hypothetical protein